MDPSSLNQVLKECYFLRQERQKLKERRLILQPDYSITIYEKFGSAIGSCIWPGSILLSKFLAKHARTYVTLKKAIELGSGCGLCGITFALFGGYVVLTERDDACLELLKHNVRANKSEIDKNNGRALVCRYSWGDPITSIKCDSVDIILASDCIYAEECVQPFIETVIKIFKNKGAFETKLLLAYRKRDINADTKLFHGLKVSGLLVETIIQEDMDTVFEIRQRRLAVK